MHQLYGIRVHSRQLEHGEMADKHKLQTFPNYN